MNNESTIIINSVSKVYRLYSSKMDFVKEILNPFRKIYHKKYYALKEISFRVSKGEVIGVIGRNGSGKSTLLKILASVVTPTQGDCHCIGKVAVLLELSAGFDIQLTGVQNLKFLGRIIGFSKKEISEKIDSILEFADIGEYAYQPVKNYSSGMYMRLAFSLAIHVDPEVLIVDEILGVGDMKFQKKCFERIKQFKEEGKTIILCSHNLSAINDFCTRALWINKGILMKDDLPKVVIKDYQSFLLSNHN